MTHNSYLKQYKPLLRKTPLRAFKPINKGSKSERKQLIKDLDEIFRDIIRLRDKCICQRTGKTSNIQVAHFYSREYTRTRWDMDNACCLNANVHINWAHVKHQEFQDWWLQRIGKEAFDRLKLKAQVRGTVYTCNLRLLKKDLLTKKKYYERKLVNE